MHLLQARWPSAHVISFSNSFPQTAQIGMTFWNIVRQRGQYLKKNCKKIVKNLKKKKKLNEWGVLTYSPRSPSVSHICLKHLSHVKWRQSGLSDRHGWASLPLKRFQQTNDKEREISKFQAVESLRFKKKKKNIPGHFSVMMDLSFKSGSDSAICRISAR